MKNYYKLENGTISMATPYKELAEKCGCNLQTDKNILRGYDGHLYFENELPEKPQSIINAERIEELKGFLAAADYWGQKYIDGEYTDDEWNEKKALRKAWREEIRQLEGE